MHVYDTSQKNELIPCENGSLHWWGVETAQPSVSAFLRRKEEGIHKIRITFRTSRFPPDSHGRIAMSR